MINLSPLVCSLQEQNQKADAKAAIKVQITQFAILKARKPSTWKLLSAFWVPKQGTNRQQKPINRWLKINIWLKDWLKRSWVAPGTQPIQNDQRHGHTQLHRQNKQLPLAKGCQELQHGCGAPASDLRPQPREVTATAVLLPSPPPYPCSPTQGAAPRDAAQGCSYSSRLLFSWLLLLCMAKIICTHTTKLPAAYSGGKKREALCTLIYTLSK